MDTALEDKRIIELAERKKEKNAELKNYFLNVKKRSSSNEYLREVVDDYRQFYKSLLQHKQDQETALCVISDYLNNLHHHENQTNNQIEEDKIEQKRLQKELDHIKDEIAELIEILEN